MPVHERTRAVSHQREGRKDVHIEDTFTLTPRRGATLVEGKMHGDGNPIAGLIFYPAIRADFMTALRNLKESLKGPLRLTRPRRAARFAAP